MTSGTRRLGTLADALGLDGHGRHHVAVVGGGGKTTVAHALADQLWTARPVGPAPIVTTTTKMGVDQHRGKPLLCNPSDETLAMVLADGPAMVVDRIDGQKVVGVDPGRCDHWFTSGVADRILVEADGSRRKPFKAPKPYEPVVPATTTLMISVIGADALGRVIADQCHRPLRVAALAGCSPYVRLSPEAAATVILHADGARRELPPSAELAVVINRVDEASAAAAAELEEVLTDREPTLRVIQVARDPSLG